MPDVIEGEDTEPPKTLQRDELGSIDGAVTSRGRIVSEASMSSARTDRGTGEAALPWVVVGFGALSFAFMLAQWLWFAALIDTTSIFLGFVTIGVPALGLVWGGYRLERSEIGTGRYRRIVNWCFGGALGFLAINALVIAFFPWHNLAGNVAWAHFSLNSGAVGGFAVGYVEARAIQREVEATVADVRASQLEEEREVLTYLNDLLRHEVLNSAQIIGGHASLLLEDADDERREHLETIDRESDALTDVIDDVRAMLNANRDPEQAGVVDLGEVLDDELTGLRRRHGDAEIDATVPKPIFVDGNEGLKWIFANLLENAIEHNESEPPRVTVTVETTGETVAVEIADNGPGIPDETRERLFERKSKNHGLGLYLVRILAKRYGGSVELTETGPDGSVFTVTLSRATAETETTDEARTATDPAPTESRGEFDPTSGTAAGEKGPADAERTAETDRNTDTETETNDPPAGAS